MVMRAAVCGIFCVGCLCVSVTVLVYFPTDGNVRAAVWRIFCVGCLCVSVTLLVCQQNC